MADIEDEEKGRRQVKIEIKATCGCGFSTKESLAEAKGHAAKTGHTLDIRGSVSPVGVGMASDSGV